MIYGTTTLATSFTEDVLRNRTVRILKALLFFVPRANPDIEQHYPRVKKWVLELSDDGWPQREVGLDAQGMPLFRTPNQKNTGFWTDMALRRFERAELTEISAGDFDSLWNSIEVGQ
jgi:hypothetical protein